MGASRIFYTRSVAEFVRLISVTVVHVNPSVTYFYVSPFFSLSTATQSFLDATNRLT